MPIVASSPAPIQEVAPTSGNPQPTPSKTKSSGRQKLTPSLADLSNGKSKSAEAPPKEGNKPNNTTKASDELVTLEALKIAWNEFTEQRKSQVGEYHLLKQEFDFQNNLITIRLTNPVEEPLLQTIRNPLIEFLRERLKNKSLNVTSQVREIQTQKIAYTNKEKFEKLTEQNPVLKELKQRLDLDTDF